MGFENGTIGFNEATLTSLAYVCYLLAFLFYGVHLLTREARAVRVPAGSVALAGAGAGGGTIDVTLSSGDKSVGRKQYSPALGWIGFGLVVTAWISLTTALGIRWVEAGHPPYVTLYEITTMLVWGTTTVYLILFEGVLKVRAAGAFIVLLILCLQSYALWFIDASLKAHVPLVPALRSYWLVIHVSLAIIAYSAFATAAGAGLTYVAKHFMKGQFAAALPSSAALEEFMFRAVAVGFPFMTLVLVTGAIWAQEAWTKAWSWDPKETWALITWLTYAAYLHVRVQRGVRGLTMAWLTLIGFVIVLVTFLGVNYLTEWFGIETLHTYPVENGTPGSLRIATLLVVGFFGSIVALALFSWLRIRFPRRGAARTTTSSEAD
jgi:cytochrome c-type biogenesis protein CcsB